MFVRSRPCDVKCKRESFFLSFTKYPSWYKQKVTKHDINNSDETGDHKDVKSVKSRPCDVKYKRENPSFFH